MNDTRDKGDKDDKAFPSPRDVRNPKALSRHQQDVEKAGGLRRGVSDHSLRQPNERDTAPDGGHAGTDRRTDLSQPRLPQAHRDIEEGREDTERRGTPSNVPSSRDNAATPDADKELPAPGAKNPPDAKK